MSGAAAYLSLFLAALGAATLLPLQSEALLAALAAGGSSPLLALLAVASLGNTLGALVNWALGRWILRFQDKKWFPFRPADIDKARAFYLRFGKWSLLFSWMPVIGDPLTLIAGMMRLHPAAFLAIVGTAKTARYAAVLWLVTG